ncbi:MAG: Asp23/Gls24 family envelope stress response protein, partial [Candidatus Sumerlaeota bacterium]
GISGFFSGREARGVMVELDEETGHVDINVDIDVDYGINIYESAHKLQHTIKEEVEALTGSMNVDKINIRVKHLVMPKSEEEEEEEVVPPDHAYESHEDLDTE